MELVSKPDEISSVENKNVYIIKFDYPETGMIREWYTKPMLKEDFKREFVERIAPLFSSGDMRPFTVEGERKEIAGRNLGIWDELLITSALINNPRVMISWGVKY